MSFDEFERLPRRVGWKHEYWDGQAHLRPASTVVCQELVLSARAVPPLDWQMRPPTAADREALVDAFVDAFGETVEYCDCSLEEVGVSASRAIEDCFDVRRGHPSEASRIALSRDRIGGAALIVRCDRGPRLELLLVRPRTQRRGIATALVATAVNELHAAGETMLRSRSRLANEASLAWHRAFGFEEEPDLQLALIRLQHASYELDRRSRAGELGPESTAQLRAECKRLKKWVDILEERSHIDGFEAVTPLLLD